MGRDIRFERIGNIAFVTGIFLEILVMMTDHFASWTIPYRGRITHIAFACFCCKILCSNYKKWEWAIFLSMIILGTISYITCEDEYVLRCIVFVMACKQIELNKIMRYLFVTTLFGTVIIVCLAVFANVGTVVDVRHYGRGIEEARYCLGFNHANNVHDMLWYLVSIYILIRRDKCKYYEYIVLTTVNVILYNFTISRTGFLTVQFVILMACLVKYIPVVDKYRVVAIVGVLLLAIVVPITLHSSLHNNVHCKLNITLDRLLNGRLELLFEYANRLKWEWFPGPRSAEMVDNGFGVIFYCYGIAVGILLIATILYALIKCMIKIDSFVALVVAGSILVIYMESSFVFNVSILCNMLLISLMYSMNYDLSKRGV